jgi:hypothetical protein
MNSNAQILLDYRAAPATGLLAEESVIAQRLGKLGRKKSAGQPLPGTLVAVK